MAITHKAIISSRETTHYNATARNKEVTRHWDPAAGSSSSKAEATTITVGIIMLEEVEGEGEEGIEDAVEER
jgi:hypothetical protein